MVITVSSIKGGVGKSSVVLLLANNLASRGRKVLVIDTDLNNTVTVYYTMGIGRIGEICERQNVSLAFAQGKLDGKNIIQSRKENIFIIKHVIHIVHFVDIIHIIPIIHDGIQVVIYIII